MFRKKDEEKKNVTYRKGSVLEIWHNLKKNKRAMLGLYFIVLLVIVAIGANFIAPYGMTTQNLSNKLLPPSGAHWMGTDHLGRDVFSRIIFGTRTSLMIGLASVVLSASVGATLGIVAGYFGGKTDSIIMRLTDVLLSIPSILLAIAIVAAFAPSLKNLIFAIGIAGIPTYTRIARSAVISVKEKQFIEAAHAEGMSNKKIIMRHVVPNSMSPLIVQATMGIASAILSAAGLGFIGLGIEAPTAEWGTMLNAGREYITSHPNLTLFPGLAIMLTILAFNLLGDGIRDAIDPKMMNQEGA